MKPFLTKIQAKNCLLNNLFLSSILRNFSCSLVLRPHIFFNFSYTFRRRILETYKILGYKDNSLVQNICLLFTDKTPHCRDTSALGDQATSFTKKILKISDSIIFLDYHATRYRNLSWSGPNFRGIVDFVPVMSSRGPKLNWKKIHNHLWIRSTSGKIMTSNAF